MSVELSLPTRPPEQRVYVDGWELPAITATERDGGIIDFTLDHRFGYQVPVAEFEAFSRFLADVIAVFLGMPSWPGNIPDDDGHLGNTEGRHRWMGHLPHLLRPKRVFIVTGSRER